MVSIPFAIHGILMFHMRLKVSWTPILLKTKNA